MTFLDPGAFSGSNPTGCAQPAVNERFGLFAPAYTVSVISKVKFELWRVLHKQLAPLT
jgi:hypothetical protein